MILNRFLKLEGTTLIILPVIEDIRSADRSTTRAVHNFFSPYCTTKNWLLDVSLLLLWHFVDILFGFCKEAKVLVVVGRVDTYEMVLQLFP